MLQTSETGRQELFGINESRSAAPPPPVFTATFPADHSIGVQIVAGSLKKKKHRTPSAGTEIDKPAVVFIVTAKATDSLMGKKGAIDGDGINLTAAATDEKKEYGCVANISGDDASEDDESHGIGRQRRGVADDADNMCA